VGEAPDVAFELCKWMKPYWNVDNDIRGCAAVHTCVGRSGGFRRAWRNKEATDDQASRIVQHGARERDSLPANFHPRIQIHGIGVKLVMNPRQSMKQALQGVKIFAQESPLQHIQNRLIHDRHEQTFDSSCLGVAGLSLHIRIY
jgi:hypothetical protein